MEHRSFEQIYLQYYKPVYAYLMTLCQNEELAAELTQETFYKALDAIDGFKGGCALNVWLCQIAKNTLTDTYRRQKRELPPLDDTLTDVPSPAPCPKRCRSPPPIPMAATNWRPRSGSLRSARRRCFCGLRGCTICPVMACPSGAICR